MEKKKSIEEVLTAIDPYSWFYGIREGAREDFLRKVWNHKKKLDRDEIGGNNGIHKVDHDK